MPGFFGIRDLRYLKAGIRDFTAKWGRDSGLKVYARDADAVNNRPVIYGTERKFGSRRTGLNNPIGAPQGGSQWG